MTKFFEKYISKDELEQNINNDWNIKSIINEKSLSY